MALSILNNIPSLAAQNQLAITGSSLQKTLFRLSSGSRINSGADDAAGLAIADGLHANTTALTQAARNANDGVGYLQVADGALAQVTTLLNRAVTLASESANGTLSSGQRGSLDTEYQAILSEINRIGASTTYNGTNVFTSSALSLYLAADGSTGTNSKIDVTTGALSASGVGLAGGRAQNILSGMGNVGAGDTIKVDASGLMVPGGNTTYKFVSAATLSADNGDVTKAHEVLVGNTLSESLANLAAAINGGAGAGVLYTDTTTANTDVSAVSDGQQMTLTASATGSQGNLVALTITQTTATLGWAVSGGTLSGGSDTAGLGTADAAKSSLANINTAISTVANMRGTIGAGINRLQSAVNVINNQVQNLTAAEDGIRSADIAAEVANLTKYSILNQTGISALAQANQMQQSVLSLLK